MPLPDGCISLLAPLPVRVRRNAKERCDLTSPSLLPDRGSRTQTRFRPPAAVISVLIASAAADLHPALKVAHPAITILDGSLAPGPRQRAVSGRRWCSQGLP